jgi:methyl-accepting chemotaxis protein
MSTSSGQSIADRLKFLKLDEPSLAALRTLKPLVEKHLPSSLDMFYAHLGAYPELSRFFSGAAHMDKAKNAQLSHWSNIASGQFSDGYVKSSRAIGEAHARIGLRPSWYIGGYALIAEHLVGAILAEVWPKGLLRGGAKDAGAVAVAVGALLKAVLLDMDVAISTYLDSMEETRRRAEEENARATKKHADEVDALVKEQKSIVDALTQRLERLARGDLTVQINEEVAAEYQALRSNFNHATTQLQATIGAITAVGAPRAPNPRAD